MCCEWSKLKWSVSAIWIGLEKHHLSELLFWRFYGSLEGTSPIQPIKTAFFRSPSAAPSFEIGHNHFQTKYIEINLQNAVCWVWLQRVSCTLVILIFFFVLVTIFYIYTVYTTVFSAATQSQKDPSKDKIYRNHRFKGLPKDEKKWVLFPVKVPQKHCKWTFSF